MQEPGAQQLFVLLRTHTKPAKADGAAHAGGAAAAAAGWSCCNTYDSKPS
jgi:hypothetical protein